METSNDNNGLVEENNEFSELKHDIIDEIKGKFNGIDSVDSHVENIEHNLILQTPESKTEIDIKDSNNNELELHEEVNTTSLNGSNDSGIELVSEEVLNNELLLEDEFKERLSLWSKRGTHSNERNTDSLHRETVWQIKDKFKTLKRIKNGNTRRLAEMFEGL